MNHIKEHIPGFSDQGPQEGNFNTTEELLALPFVKAWTEHPTFVRFSKSQELLMVEMTDSHWVVGYLQDPASVDLPTWQQDPASAAQIASALVDTTRRFEKVCPPVKKGNIARIVQHNKRVAAWQIGDTCEITEVVDQMCLAIVAVALTAGYMVTGYYDVEIVNETGRVLDGETKVA